MIELHIPYFAHVSIESVEGGTPDLSDKIPGIFLDATQRCVAVIPAQYTDAILFRNLHHTNPYNTQTTLIAPRRN